MLMTPTYAEEAVLGGVLLRNEWFHDVAPLLSSDHFTSPFRQRLWGALRDRILAGEAADVVTVAELMAGDAADIFDIANTCVTMSTVPTYAAIVRQNWRRREAGQIAARLMAGARSSDDSAVDAAISALMQLNSAVTECEFTGKQAMLMAFKQAEIAHSNGGKLPGITTGLTDLDEILGGFHDSDLTIIGARPAMGKTALMLGLAEASSGAGKRTGVVSAEQPAQQIGVRRLSLASSVGAASIRAGQFHEEDWSKLHVGVTDVQDRPMWIYDRSAITLDELIGVARKWKHTHGIEILFIDYAQRITVPGTDRVTEVSTIARGLKNLARDLKIPVVALAQVVKGVDNREDKRPTAGDLANSDELTREADQILMLYREAVYYHGDTKPNGQSVRRNVAEILIEKNRHGPTGFKEVAFLGETMRFANLTRESF